MKKTKQVLAIIAIVLLLGMYVAAFVLAFMKSEHAQILFRAALGATILVPVLLYLVLMVARMLKPAKSAVIDMRRRSESPRRRSGRSARRSFMIRRGWNSTGP